MGGTKAAGERGREGKRKREMGCRNDSGLSEKADVSVGNCVKHQNQSKVRLGPPSLEACTLDQICPVSHSIIESVL